MTPWDSARPEEECHRAPSPVFAGALPLSRGTDPEGAPKEGHGPAGLGTESCPGHPAEVRAEGDDVPACTRCALIEDLRHYTEVSLEEISQCAPSGKKRKAFERILRHPVEMRA